MEFLLLYCAFSYLFTWGWIKGLSGDISLLGYLVIIFLSPIMPPIALGNTLAKI